MKKHVITVLALIIAGSWLPAFAQQESLADAARKVREQKKEMPRAKRVYTNDELASQGSAAVSVVGSAAPSAGAGETTSAGGAAEQTGGGAAAGAKPAEKNPAEDEAAWRKKFSELRAKIAGDEKEIDIMQRELNLSRQQYYSDPNVAMREQYKYPSGSGGGGDINDMTKKIADKKTELDALKQQLSELEDDLRRAGAPASWARE
jgi:hypothetical protein